MAFNKQEKLRDNIEAIRLLFDLESSKRAASIQEREILSLLWIWRFKVYIKSPR